MEITLFGIIHILLCLSFFFLPIKYSGGLVIYSCIFQAAADFIIGGKGITPIVISEVFLIGRYFSLSKESNLYYLKVDNWVKLVFYFIFICCLTSFVFPFIFEGVKVYSNKVGSEANFYRGADRLIFSLNNIFQILYLVINLLTVYIFLKLSIEFNFLYKSFINAIISVIFIGFWEFWGKRMGFYFPQKFFFSNSAYAQLYDQVAMEGIMRLNATFTEASFAGSFLASSFWAMICIRNKKTNILVALLGVAIALNLSGTGLVAFSFGLLIYLFFNNFRNLWNIIICIFLFLLLSYMLGYWDLFLSMVLGKSSSESGQIRSDSNMFTINLILETYGLGVGLGSHRASSLVLTLFSSIGFLGFLLFILLLKNIITLVWTLRRINVQFQSILAYFSTMVFAETLAIPDVSFPPFWMGLFLLAGANNYIRKTIGLKL